MSVVSLVCVPGGALAHNLLNLCGGRQLGFELTGTSDACILDSDILRSSKMHDLAVRALFELKKSVQEKDVKQAAAQLISAAFKAQFSPFVVLTELRDDWTFL